MHRKSFLLQQLHALRNSFFALGITVLLIVLIDALFYAFAVQAGIVYAEQLQKKYDAVDLQHANLFDSFAGAQDTLNSVRSFFFYFVGSSLGLLAIVIFGWSIAKGIIWSLTMHKKITKRFLIRFLVLNFIWIGIWILIFIVWLVVLTQNAVPFFFFGTLIVVFFFTTVLYPLFLEKNSYMQLKRTFVIGTSRIHYFLVPYTVIALIAFGLFSIRSMGTTPSFVWIIVLLFIVAWMRYYIVEVMKIARSKQ